MLRLQCLSHLAFIPLAMAAVGAITSLIPISIVTALGVVGFSAAGLVAGEL